MIRFTTKKLTLALLATSALTTPALAQEANFVPKPREAVDQNGVDLAAGKARTSTTSIGIGTAVQGLSFFRPLNIAGSGGASRWGDPYSYAAYGTAGSSIQVIFGGSTRSFLYNSSTSAYVNQQGTGETLSNSGSTWTFTARDGTIATMDGSDFDPAISDHRYAAQSAVAVAHTVVAPNGQRLTLTYKAATFTRPTGQSSDVRLQSVQSSNGYMAKYEYEANSGSAPSTWTRVTKVTLLNSSVDYCDAAADSCTFSTSWPSLTFTSFGSGGLNYATATDLLNRTTTYGFGTGLVSVRRPTSSTANETVVYDTNGRVQSLTIDGRTWTYSWSVSAPLITATVTNPDSSQRVYVTDTSLNVLKSFKDELNRTTTYTYDSAGRLTDITYPEGNKSHYVYDSRGNVTEGRAITKVGSGLPDIVKTASYSSNCANAVTCNRPTSVTDAKGNVTDFTYDSTHGGLLTATAPAPTTGATRPQARYGYTALQAYYKNNSGSIVASGQATYLLTSTSICQTTSICSGGADEVKATITYGPQTSGTANNLLPVSNSSGAGDGSLTATQGMTYDVIGNLTYVDGPLSGTADTTRTLYDADREVIGQIRPDPDGAGALPNVATRLSYNADGQVTKTESGTTAGQSDTAWAAFTAAEYVDTAYDASGRVSIRTLKNGSTFYALTQNSYDSRGRLDCTAVRMNPSIYGSLPSSACTLGTSGSVGSDRISQIVYDAASQPTQLKVAVGTSDAATEQTLTYTNNGLILTLLDAESNKTTYEYDGFDRLSKTRYPGTTKGSGTSSATDYEQLAYDANSNVTSLRIRDGNSITFDYDNLNRVTAKHRPSPEFDVTYDYDLLGRVAGAHTNGYSAGFIYDALGRKVVEGGLAGQRYSQYDLAGRRIRLTHYDGFYVDYDYLVTGEVSKVRENGATSGVGVLTSYGYDNLGRRTSITFGNGVTQAFSYDPVSRLASLSNDLSGTTNDLSETFAYNPASQIAQTVRTGDTYAWTGHGNGSATTVTNGLNELSSVGATSAAYDAKGNLTTDPVTGRNNYFYTSENLLREPGYGVGYDSLNRLFYVNTSQWVMDGDDAVAEYVGSSGYRRYVFDPDGQPIVWYEGTGTSERRFLSADERGSVVSATDGGGSLIGINSYDEYGRPGSANVGRFGYIGQMWIPEYSLNYFHARMYAPHLGRFMQTDPIGIAGGINLYAYTANDPVNLVDPFGLEGCGSSDCGDIVITATRPPPTTFNYVLDPLPFNTYQYAAADLTTRFPALGDRLARLRKTQREACNGPAFQGILGDPRVEARIAEARAAARSTQNRGIDDDIPSNGSEYGFWAARIPIYGAFAGTIRTDYREAQVGFSRATQPWFGSSMTAIHTHQSPRGTGILSGADIDLTYPPPRGLGVNIVALNEDGARYCRAAQ